MLVLCAAAPATSFAAQSHLYTGVSFGPDGVGGSASFEYVRSIATDPASGDVFVYDVGAEKIYKFDEDGNPIDFSALAGNAIAAGGGGFGPEYQVAIAPPGSPGGTAGDIYVANNGESVQVYAPDGTKFSGEIKQGGETCGVATDPSGNIYAGVYPSTVNRYTPDANPPTTAGKTTATVDQSTCNVAADGLGNVYAAYYSGLYKLEGMDDSTLTAVDPQASTMAVALGSNDVYADRGTQVVQYDSSGSPIGHFGEDDLAESQGIAVNSGATKIYVGTPSKVKVFGPRVTVPDATTEAADAISKVAATLHGSVGAAGGPDATCVFQYISNQQYFEHHFEGAAEAPCSPAGPFTGSSTTGVNAAVTGLNAETMYRFRVLASSANGPSPGQVLNFTTSNAVNVRTGAATSIAETAATFNGTINPEGIPVEECFFEYGIEESSGSTVPCAESVGSIGSGNGPVAVHADVSGLVQLQAYRFRLVARNDLGTTNGEEESFRTKGPPRVQAESVSGVTLTSAKLEALVNPGGEAATYRFQYVSEADFKASGYTNATEVPLGGEAIEAGDADVVVAAEINDLAELSTYHYRVLITSSRGTDTGKDKLFTTYTTEGGQLPDGRVYEQATPVDKAGSNPKGGLDLVLAANDGSGITYYSNGVIPGADGGQQFPGYLAKRATDGSGWATQGLLPPASNGPVAYFRGSSEDLSRTYSTQGPAGGVDATLYERDSATGAIRSIAGGLKDGEDSYNAYAASSADDSRVLIGLAGYDLPSGAAPNSPNTYVWEPATETLHLVGVLNDQQSPAGGTTPGSFSPRGGRMYTLYENAISRDGARVFFSSIDTHQIYLRQNPTRPQSPMDGDQCSVLTDACTVEVSAPEEGINDPNGRQPATLAIATPDGSLAFFTSPGKLTANATTGPEDNGKDLYRFNADSGELTDLTPDTVDPNGAEVQGVVGASDDGSYIYFVANGVLAPGASPGDCKNEQFDSSGYNDNFLNYTTGDCNLYLWHDGEISFIAPQNAGAGNGPGAENWLRNSPLGEQEKSARVTPDGRTLIFRSQEELTSYDNEGSGEIYRYSADDGKLVCVSCAPSGIPPLGPASLQGFRVTTGNSDPPRSIQTRNLSADGQRVFFETPDKLVAADVNGDDSCLPPSLVSGQVSFSCQDVYEWEADGSGSCHSSAQNGGCLYLLSSGTSSEASYFGDASASGNDVFLFTVQPLVAQDKDQLIDIYDARVDGGIASQNEMPRPICEGDACLGPATPPPAYQSPDSASFFAPGNPKPTRRHKKKRHRKRRHQEKKSHQKSHGNGQQRSAHR
jgi:hypothetical protein